MRYRRHDGTPEIDYPNAEGSWHGCPMTCPETCPFEECSMPPEIAARLEPPHWHGWVTDEEGNIVPEKPKRKWAKAYKEAVIHGRNE